MGRDTNWADELRRRKAANDSSIEDLKAAKQQLRDLVAELSYKLPIAEVAGWVDWSVSYIHKLRTDSEVVVDGGVPADAYQQVQLALADVSAAEQVHEACRQYYLKYIKEVAEPAPSMTDVAKVIGVSRQRVAQLIAS